MLTCNVTYAIHGVWGDDWAAIIARGSHAIPRYMFAPAILFYVYVFRHFLPVIFLFAADDYLPSEAVY